MEKIKTPTITEVEQAAGLQLAEVNKIAVNFNSDFEVKTADEAQEAAADLKIVKMMIDKVEDTRKSFTRPLDDLKKRFMELFRPAETELKEAENYCKRALLSYQQEQDNKAREEARRLREEQEKKNRAEQERIKKELEAAKEAQETAELMDDYTAMEQANQKKELLQQEQLSAAAIDLYAPHAQETKIEGTSTTKNWKGEITDIADLVRYISASNNFYNLIEANNTAINQLAKSTKGTLKIPGIRFYAEDVLRVNKR
jgi:hypothetical protein